MYLYLPTRWCDYHELTVSLKKVPNSALCHELINVIEDMNDTLQNDDPQKRAKQFIMKLGHSIDLEEQEPIQQAVSSQSQDKIGFKYSISNLLQILSWKILAAL